MVLFVSGRTDVLSYYPKWFLNRLKEGFVDVRNPFNKKLVNRIYFKNVDLIVFCTKNPHPFLKYLDEAKQLIPSIPFVFHITLTPYSQDIEPIIYKYKKSILKDIIFLSKKFGKDNIFLRYDPIIKNNKYTLNYHIKAFDALIKQVGDFVSNIVISFIDIYKNTTKHNNSLKIEDFSKEDYKSIATNFLSIIKDKKINIFTCAEENNLIEYGFSKNNCVSKEYIKFIEEKFNLKIKTSKSTFRKKTSKACECIKMVDIGSYNSCLSFCKYCYANYNEKEVINNYKAHDDNSSLLIGNIEKDDIIKVRGN